MKHEVNKMKGFPSTLCTIGGFVVGTSALRMLLLDGNKSNPIKKQILRGTSPVLTGVAPAIGNIKDLDRDDLGPVSTGTVPDTGATKDFEMDHHDLSPVSRNENLANGDGKGPETNPSDSSLVFAQAASANDHGKDPGIDPYNLIPVSTGSASANGNGEDLTIDTDINSVSADAASADNNGEDLETDPHDLSAEELYKWTYDGVSPSVFNTTNGRLLFQSPSLRSVEELHQDIAPTSSVVTSRRTTYSGNNSAGFRLKLYWQKGYYWQESRNETWWCMSCGFNGQCATDEVMRLVSEKYMSHGIIIMQYFAMSYSSYAPFYFSVQVDCETKSDADAVFELIRH